MKIGYRSFFSSGLESRHRNEGSSEVSEFPWHRNVIILRVPIHLYRASVTLPLYFVMAKSLDIKFFKGSNAFLKE